LEKLMEDDATCKRGKPFAPGNRSGKGRPDGSRNHWALELLEGEPCSPRLGITMLSWPAALAVRVLRSPFNAIVKIS
jgi:hypothetical protein